MPPWRLTVPDVIVWLSPPRSSVPPVIVIAPACGRALFTPSARVPFWMVVPPVKSLPPVLPSVTVPPPLTSRVAAPLIFPVPVNVIAFVVLFIVIDDGDTVVVMFTVVPTALSSNNTA